MDIIFKSQFTLIPRTELSIADTLSKIFPVRYLYTFHVRNFFQLKLSSIFVL